MLDRKTELMLEIANTLSAEELNEIRASAAAVVSGGAPTTVTVTDPPEPDSPPPPGSADDEDDEGGGASGAESTRGQRERERTRESKVSTDCLGKPRESHEWWPVGTELVGQIGAESFMAVVIANHRVKSGCSIQITSGAAKGQVCLTPTRAAIEATEAYRQAHNLGRGGGITNGWTFWKPKP